MVKRRFDNPFHDLWVTEILDSDSFVKLFSDVLVKDTEALFSTGNIVLKGRQGCGKSMLLRLLNTSTRIAYSNANIDYPVPKEQRKFISAGVHLIHENFSSIGSRVLELPEKDRSRQSALIFSDYFNVLLCLSLLNNIEKLHKEQEINNDLITEVSINFSKKNQEKFLNLLINSDTWPDVLQKKCNSLRDVVEILEKRRRVYLQYFNSNIDDLPQYIKTTRSVAGIPISELAEALRNSNILPKKTLVLLRVDQHEELYEIERKCGLGSVFRQVLNSVLAHRDARVAYRIGTRHYAWETEESCWGSGAPLEIERDYSPIDLDEILRRKESSKGWKFPELAKDVVKKRISFAGFKSISEPIDEMFGKSLSPKEKAVIYAGNSPSLVKKEDSWVQEWKDYLDSLWENGEPLDAKFGEVWLRQKAQQKKHTYLDGSQANGLPWRNSQWWIKERNEIALMQIAGDKQQAMIWSGARQVIDLAGGNILAFMTVCKIVWATWQRRNINDAEKYVKSLPKFSLEDQRIGIMEASQLWFDKINVSSEAEKRILLIRTLGAWFRKKMLADRSLSYPGHNGFSLSLSEFSSDSKLVDIIRHCRDHGDILESRHTTKSKDQKPRIKWYLHPLLCPTFRIPHVRTKEPIYTSLNELYKLIDQPKKIIKGKNDSLKKVNSPQFKLPGL